MKILSDNAVTKDDLNNVRLKLEKKINALQISVSVLFVINVALTVALRIFS